ncbi:hypothetical protein KVV02_002662 [Mortierella alpina]|uniref:MULE transposase domain-containing protein n=1 Tax=Mortierella alpina TaxID=64518 RepID=A0A9P8D2B9_MORAP|nr:hypothetical protein KVV02_002662 [Mortierella alpina]
MTIVLFINRSKEQLYTIVVKSYGSGFGIPVAFLMTNSTDPAVFQSWFNGLKKKMWDNFRISYTPKVVVTDQGSVEILAIRSAFSPVRIYYCAWHVLRAWERKLTNALLGVEGTAFTADDRKSVRTELRRIMYESQLDKATALIEKFRLDHVERTDLAKHLEEGYSPRTKSNDGCSATAKIYMALLLVQITTWNSGTAR